MDFVVKVADGYPATASIIHACRGNRKQEVNGHVFGYSDKFGAVISEPLTGSASEIYRYNEGFQILDARTGEVVAEGDVSRTPKADDFEDALTPVESPNAPIVPPTGEEWAKGFITTVGNMSDADRTKLGKDELRRALTELNVALGPDDDETSMIAKVLAYGKVKTDIDVATQSETNDNEWLETFKARYSNLSETSRASVVTGDELRRALAALKVVNVGADATKADMRKLLEEALAQ